MNIRIPGKPLTDAFQAGRNYDFGHLGNYRFTAFGELAAKIWCGRHAPESWLHRTRRNLEWLKKKCADAHSDGERDEQYFDVFTPDGIGIWLKAKLFVVRGIFERLHLFLERFFIHPIVNRLLQIRDCSFDC